MPGEEVGSEGGVVVAAYAEPPPRLLALLRLHAPHSLPLLRRLEFTRFPGGITEHARILWASEAALQASSPESGSELESDSDIAFAAGYLDLSRSPETELWLYSTLERTGSDADDALDATASSSPAAAAAHAAGDQAAALMREVRRLREAYAGGRERAEPQRVLAGGLNERLRRALTTRGLAFPLVTHWDKWLFRVDGLPDVATRPLPPGMRWGAVDRADIPTVLARSSIQRTERTLLLLRSVAIKLEDGTPIAWALLGPDSSLSSLHCEPEYRGRGLAKAVAVKLLRDHLKDYDDVGYGWADVAPDNLGSQGVCRSLGGRIAWAVSWTSFV